MEKQSAIILETGLMYAQGELLALRTQLARLVKRDNDRAIFNQYLDTARATIEELIRDLPRMK